MITLPNKNIRSKIHTKLYIFNKSTFFLSELENLFVVSSQKMFLMANPLTSSV